MDGAIQEPTDDTPKYWRGSYTARGIRDSSGNTTYYREYKIKGFSTSIGDYHTYQISRVSGPNENGKYQWGVYVDYKLQRSFYTSVKYCHAPDVGLETNNSSSTSARWNEHSIQRIVDWNWENWQRSSTTLSSSGGASVIYTNSSTGNSIYTSK